MTREALHPVTHRPIPDAPILDESSVSEEPC
jgi:hypothetical protein